MKLRDIARFSPKGTRGLTGRITPPCAVVPAITVSRCEVAKEKQEVTQIAYRGMKIKLHERRGSFQSYDIVDNRRGVWVCGFFNPDIENPAAVVEMLKENLR